MGSDIGIMSACVLAIMYLFLEGKIKTHSDRLHLVRKREVFIYRSLHIGMQIGVYYQEIHTLIGALPGEMLYSL